ncbi:unknown protein (plasmid) [Synechocystis sp. PCC 6803]|uniref:Uncharacterized protein n=1 Tax=Synechocystis sp. (strain ATCC 27184 / PCC 6803 / Kazusa) TaxID=1111708 RepID=Q6ZEL0_SYNY3|nr:hypothetical protein MYO_21210 [Synechocystis sp. PCC 6803]AVP91669.1 hypothetical protein C7I86_18070 [Synechocystis sp. IPPAS B-1465]MCW5241989.1 hypothetical protein [Synechocystis sp. PCC 6803]BAD01890.1 unknown protein [Synechocystis sp. PCC 6803]
MPLNIDPTESRALAGRTLPPIINQQELLAIAIYRLAWCGAQGATIVEFPARFRVVPLVLSNDFSPPLYRQTLWNGGISKFRLISCCLAPTRGAAGQ